MKLVILAPARFVIYSCDYPYSIPDGTDQCYSLLITAIREILGMESAGQLTTEVEAVDYIIQANSSSSNDEVVCPENTVNFYLYCGMSYIW